LTRDNSALTLASFNNTDFAVVKSSLPLGLSNKYSPRKLVSKLSTFASAMSRSWASFIAYSSKILLRSNSNLLRANSCSFILAAF
jgi:hypothetical protein